MIGTDVLLSFFATSILLALTPGPDNIFVLTQSVACGRDTGIAVVFGLCTGIIFHTVAVALGIAVIFQTSVFAFSVLKYLGAAYLVYLAWQMFRAPIEKMGRRADMAAPNLFSLYRRGIIMNITNPKVSLFFLAFLPQFTNPAKGSVPLQLFILGGLFILATMIIFGGIALLAGVISKELSSSFYCQKIINRVAGAVFLGLAIKLAVTKQ